MEFFGITHYGPQNFFNDILIEEYKEPLSKEDVKLLMEKVLKYSTCPNNFQRPDADVARTIDCYMGKVNGFAYGSSQRFIKMKRKGVMKPVGPADMYRFPPVTSVDYGWWQCDPVLANAKWFITNPRYPKPASPNSLILDKVRKNNKYASLF